MSLHLLAARLLQLEPSAAQLLIELPLGLRSIRLFATPPGLDHGFGGYRQVLVKFYKGDGSTTGNKAYRTYHGLHFKNMTALTGNRHIQQSLDAGIDRSSGVPHPYSILEYIPGKELANVLKSRRLTIPEAIHILNDIMLEIWIPLWSAGLRFKDCHPGNFIVLDDGGIVMIDTEQLRKDVAEFLRDPECWKQRDQHEALGLQRLPGLVTRLIHSARLDCPEATIKREIERILADIRLPDLLRRLGRRGADSDAPGALGAAKELADQLARAWG